MAGKVSRPQPGKRVRLKQVPHSLIHGLPKEAQQAILEAARKTFRLNEYDQYGYAELQFTDKRGNIHFIWVKPRYIAEIR